MLRTSASPADSAYAHGLLLRWLVVQGVPVTSASMRWSEDVAAFLGSRRSVSPLMG